jgi:hypothetical protein
VAAAATVPIGCSLAAAADVWCGTGRADSVKDVLTPMFERSGNKLGASKVSDLHNAVMTYE